MGGRVVGVWGGRGRGRFDDATEQTRCCPDQKSVNELRDLLLQTIGKITGAESAASLLLFIYLFFFTFSYFSNL